MSAGVALRDEIGLFLKGGPTPNTEGKNQYTRGSKAAVLRRLEKRILALLADETCVESLAENWKNAIVAPDLAPVTARIATERIWPAKHDLGADGAGDGASAPSEEQQVRLAEVFGEAFPRGTRLVLESDERSAETGAD